jgi:8-amino-7-oxononanoate synthase
MLAVGIALAKLLAMVGVRPHVVAGHSLGEFTAAAVAGVLSADDAARFVARRGRSMAALDGDHGAMAAVMAPREDVEPLLVDGAVIANVNHPRQVVVSGTSAAIDQVVANAMKAEVRAKKLTVSHAFHSPVLTSLDATEWLAGIDVTDPELPIASGIDAGTYRDAAHATDVFSRHATSPVDFVRALQTCQEGGADLFLQVGAGGPLASFARGSLAPGHRGVLNLANTDDHDGGRSLLGTLGQLWIMGTPVDIDAVVEAGPLTSLPPTILPKERYWVIKSEPQLPLKLAGARERPARATVATVEPVEVDAIEGSDPVETKVLAIVSKVSAYPLAALKPALALTDDLGFDSLMVTDLATGLADAFEGLEGIPQELLINRPTVQDIIDYARTAGQGAMLVHDDDAPLTAYTPVWHPAPHPDLPGAPALPATVAVVGSAPAADHVATALIEAGCEVTGPERADALIIVQLDEPVSLSAVLAGERSAPDHATEVLALLASRAAEPPTVMLIVRPDDPWAAGPTGAMRAAAAEWPAASIRTAVAHPGVDIGAACVAELSSTDRSIDVAWTTDGRLVAGLEATNEPDEWDPTAHRVLITGGTRGIGTKVANAIIEAGGSVVVVGRSAPGAEAAALVTAHPNRALAIQADVTDRAGLSAAVADVGAITALVHAAGVLADGALDEVDPTQGALARAVKVDGWLNAIVACGSSLTTATAIGSWAGRFGNRHQAHYGAANAQLAALASGLPGGVRASVAEFGPWVDSEMVRTIPAPIQATMRAEGVSFVGDRAGVQTVLDALGGHDGPVVLGRDLPSSQRRTRARLTLSVETDPYLLDHAVAEVPVLPLAAATDMLAWVAGVKPPFVVDDVRLFQGVTVKEPVELELSCRAGKAEIRIGERRALAYRATVSPAGQVDVPAPTVDGDPPTLALTSFYDGITFHGPLLQGITAIQAVGDTFVRGTVRPGTPAAWSPASTRSAFIVDPLALDSAMQLSGYVAWTRYERAGTPVGIGRYTQLRPWPAGELTAEVYFTVADGDRFTGTIVLRDADGPVCLAEDVVAELREREDGGLDIDPAWTDPSLWPEAIEISRRLQAAEAFGIRNPYFTVHQGTARNTTIVDGRSLVNFSSYNYLGLSGDPRVLDAVDQAVRTYGTSVSASRVASGERPFHAELESELAACQGSDDALVFTAGHMTNVNTVGHIMKPEDLVLHDELIHDSILQGIKLSGASRRAFKHDDPADLQRQLQTLRKNFKKCLIIVEGVYSMDGDICDLPAYIALKKRFGCMLMVDEAHSFGICGETGKGVSEHFGIDGSEVDLWMGTLSKSLASCGGWIAASQPMVDYLRYTTPGFVYSAGITPANGMAALASLRLMLAEPWRVKKLQENCLYFHDECDRRGLDTGPARGESAVVPIVTGNSFVALQLSQRLMDAGINVQPIVYPAVSEDSARLRFFLSSSHTTEELGWSAETIANTLKEIRTEFRL